MNSAFLSESWVSRHGPSCQVYYGNVRAEIVAVGTEILLGQITDTNSVELGKVFAACGVDHLYRQTVGDNLGRLVETLKLALSRSDLVVTIGGLGPTQDDLTRDGISLALDSPLVLDQKIENNLKLMFEQRRLPWLSSQSRQAQRPSCATTIENPNGTAPGLFCSKGDKFMIALPGPSNEFLPMVENFVKPWLMQKTGGQMIGSRILKIIGKGESIVEEILKDLMEQSDPTVAPYAKTGEVHIRITTKAESQSEVDSKLAPVVREIRQRLGTSVYGENDDRLESITVDLLRSAGATVSCAESCTGGWLGQRLTSVPGSSDVFLGGVISYANSVKAEVLGVSDSILSTKGAVSEECAIAMAVGASKITGSSYAISITGVAGPDGGAPDKPVGLVWIGIAAPKGVKAHRFLFPGLRDTVRLRGTQMALHLLRESLLQLNRD